MVEALYRDFRIGLLISVLAHGLFFYIVFFVSAPAWKNFGQPIVYSVTLEGGKSLGGISQVAQEEKKTPIAPPKAIGAEPEKVQKKQEDDAKNAEVSLREKQEAEKKKLAEEKKAAEKKKADELKKKADEEKAKAVKEKAELEKQYQKTMQRYLGESSDAGGKGFGAARLGGKGMGGGILRSPEFIAYYNLLRGSIKKGWNWFDSRSPLKAVVYLEIGRNGAISNVSITTGSGNSEFDDSVIRAVYKASPVPPPPPSVYRDFERITIEFTPTDEGIYEKNCPCACQPFCPGFICRSANPSIYSRFWKAVSYCSSAAVPGSRGYYGS